MTFISKIPQLFLTVFFGSFIMLFAFLSIEKHTGASGNNFLAILFLGFLLFNPFNKAREVYGEVDLSLRVRPFVFLGVLASVAFVVMISVFAFAMMCSFFITQNAFETCLDFFVSSHLILVYALLLYVVFVGLTMWFFSNTAIKKEITHLDRWQKIFDFVLYIASILILVSDAQFHFIIKIFFVISFFVAMWKEKQNVNKYF